MNELLPTSIVGLEEVAWTSPLPGPGLVSAGSAQMFPDPANGVVELPIAQTSLFAAVTLAPGLAPKPSKSSPPVLPLTIVFWSVRTSLVSPSTPATAPVPVAWLPDTVELTSFRLYPPGPSAQPA